MLKWCSGVMWRGMVQGFVLCCAVLCFVVVWYAVVWCGVVRCKASP